MPLPCSRPLGLALLATVVTVSCRNRTETSPSASSSPTPVAETGTSRLVSDEELARMRREVDSALSAHRAVRCVRALLRGAAVPGTADEDLVALVEASGALAACEQASPEGLRDSLSVCPPGDDRVSGPIAEPCRGRSLDDGRSLESHVMTSTMACQELDDAIARAVSHDDACSPYLPGRRAPPTSFRGFIALARSVEVRARHLAQEGQTAAALRLVLDWLRAAQDLGRGGAGFLPVMVATAAMQGPLNQAEVILAEGRLSSEELETLASAIDALLATEPKVAEVLAGDRLDMLEADILPALDGGGVPPPAPSPLPTRSFSNDPRDEIGLVWLAMEATHAAERAACPAEASLKSCLEGLERVAAEDRAAADRLPRDAPRSAVEVARAQAITVLRSVATGVHIPFVRRLAFRRARLAALRLHVEWLRTAARTGACPTPAQLSGGPLGAALTPAGLGASLLATASAGGAVDLAAPEVDAPVRLWTLRCPPSE